MATTKKSSSSKTSKTTKSDFGTLTDALYSAYKSVKKSSGKTSASSKTSASKSMANKTAYPTDSFLFYRKSDVKREVNTAVKKNKGTIVLVVCLFAVFALFGFLTGKVLTKNDTFVLSGEKSVTLTVGDTYEDAGYFVIAYGKDLSAYVKITVLDVDGNVVDALDTASEAEYAIIYELDGAKAPSGLFEKLGYKKYASYKQIRQVTVRGGGNG